tara:strand:- start:943 stop:1326 length:384 start_codon:yes stop_codon:yes gene_type:complete
MAITREILKSHPVGTLRSELKKSNVKGIATMKKAQVIDEMMKRADLFDYIKMAPKRTRQKKKEKEKKTLKPPQELKDSVNPRVRLKPPKELKESVKPERRFKTKEERDKRLKEIAEKQKKRMAGKKK